MTDIGSPGQRGRIAYPFLAAFLAFSAVITMIIAMTASSAGAAPGPVDLGTASSFAVLGATTVTNTGNSVISGDLGLSPGTSVTGFPPGVVVNGSMQITNALAAQAQSDLTTAYNAAAAQTPTAPSVAFLGAGQTLTAGVYNATSSLDVGGTLILDGQGDPNSVFIFQVGSTLTTDVGTDILLTNGANACNVYWQVGSSATLNTSTTFQGSVMALTSIAVQHRGTIVGRMLASTGAVTLDDDSIITPTSCGPAPSPSPSSPTPSPTTTSPSPTPSPTTTSPSPTPSPTTTSPSPTPSPTTTSPSPTPSPTTTSPSPTPSPTTTSPSPTPSPTTTSPSPTPSPTRVKHHRHKHPRPAPVPTPVPTTVPVTG